MPKSALDAQRLVVISTRLGDAVIDPALWPTIMEQITAAIGATGAALLQSDVRTSDIPRTVGIDELINSYFADGWHERDIRAARAVPLQQNSPRAVTDQDIVTPEEMQRSGLYAELLQPRGFKWWAAVPFWAGSALWALSIQRSIKEGPFEADDKLALALLSERLTETANLSTAVGRAVLSGVTNALNLVKKPALALDRLGFVLDANAEAEQIFGDDIWVHNRRLMLRDPQAKASFDGFVDQLRTTPDTAALPVTPIVVQRRTELPLLIRILPIDGAAKSPFLGARALLVLTDLRRTSGPHQPAPGCAGADLRSVAGRSKTCRHCGERYRAGAGGRPPRHLTGDGT